MNKEPENSDSDYGPQVHSEDSSSENIEPSHKEDSFFETEEPVESENEKPIDEDSASKKKSYSKKRWLFLLFLIFSIGAGRYFYIQENRIDLPITLPSDLNKSLPFTTKTSKTLAAQSETGPTGPDLKAVEQLYQSSNLEKTTSENEKTINFLRDEIRSLKTELTKKSSSPSPQNVQNIIPHISGRTLREEIKDLTWKKGEESESEIKIALTPPLPVKPEPNISSGTLVEETEESTDKEAIVPEPEIETSLILHPLVRAETALKQNQHQKISPQRSKEVQAYLDFIEDTGNKLVRLIKEGWTRLQK